MVEKANKHRGFTGVRAREILERLFTNYGEILAQDLVANRVKMGEKWDPTTLFQTLVTKVQDIQELAKDGGSSIEEVDIIYVLYTLIYNTGVYYEECNKWSDKATGYKTWENFQTFFQDAQRKQLNKSQATTQITGYHVMNAMVPHESEDTNEAIINVALAVVSDKETIASQTRIIERLTETISTFNAELSGTNRSTETRQSKKWVNVNHVLDIGSYCWSHGYCFDPTHNSGTCKKENNHKAEATRDNPLGGCAYGKPKNM